MFQSGDRVRIDSHAVGDSTYRTGRPDYWAGKKAVVVSVNEYIWVRLLHGRKADIRAFTSIELIA